MSVNYASLEIFERHGGDWAYRFHGETFTCTRSGFDSGISALEVAKQGECVQVSGRSVRIVVTEDVKRQLGLDSVGEVRSAIPGGDLVAIPMRMRNGVD